MSPYYTLLIPHVPDEFRTQWHPTESTGPFSLLSRGAFPTLADAIRWAQAHLNGTPYAFREIRPDEEP